MMFWFFWGIKEQPAPSYCGESGVQFVWQKLSLNVNVEASVLAWGVVLL